MIRYRFVKNMNANETRKLAAALTGEPSSRFETLGGLKDAVKFLKGTGNRSYLIRSEYASLCKMLKLDVDEDATIKQMARKLMIVGRECRRSSSLADEHRRNLKSGDIKPTIVFLDMFAAFPDAVRGCFGTEFLNSGYDFDFVVDRVDRRGAVNFENAAFVSPANGYGYMRGGIDGVYSKLFPGVESKVMVAMKATSTYPLEPGQVVSVCTRDRTNTWLISAPTMVKPGMNISDTSNAGWAFFAIMYEFDRLYHEKGVTTLVCPGLGTGVGGMPETRCANQIRNALRNHVYGGTDHPNLYAD